MVSGKIGTVHAVVPAGLTSYHAVLTEVTVGTVPYFLEAGFAIGTVEVLLIYQTFHAEIAAAVTELTAVCAGTAVIAHKIHSRHLGAFAAVGAEPAI